MSETVPKKKRRWIPAAIGGVILVGLAAVLFLPALFDAEAYRAQVEQVLTEYSGWDADLGEIELSLFRGALAVRPVRLSAPGGDTSTIEVERIDVHVGLLALLRKELHVESIRLQRPEMLLVRPDSVTGWVHPSVAGPDEPGAEGGSSATGKPVAPETGQETAASRKKPGFTVVIEEIGIRDGTLRFEDRALTPATSIELTGVTSSFRPADGGITGSLSFGDSGGEASWRGQVGNTVEISLNDVGTEILKTFVGPDLIQTGGRLSGAVTLKSPLRLEGNLSARGLTLLSGERPFEDAALDFAISPAGLGWRLENLEFRAGEARLIGSGGLSPTLALVLELPKTSLEAALRAAESVLPLPLDVSPPGNVEATIHVDQSKGKPLTYTASGSLSAAELRAGVILPPAKDVLADFKLDRTGRLDVQVKSGTVAGGAVRGGATIASIDPPGTLTFSGGLQDAVFGQLLGGIVREAQPVRGSTGFDAELGIDLTREALDARSLSGRVDFGAQELSMPGWDLDAAVRAKLEEKASSGTAGLVQGLLDRKTGKSDVAAGEVVEKVERLIDSLRGTLVFDRWPWGLEDVQLTVGDVLSTGNGSFDPEKGDVDFTLVSRLGAAASKTLLDKYGVLKVLADRSGNLVLPVRVQGSLVSPKIRVEIDKALEGKMIGDDGKDDVKGLLKGLLDRKKKND